MTDLERKNLRRAMYSREAVRTEEDEEGERSREMIACVDDCNQYVHTDNDRGERSFPLCCCV